LNDAVRPLNVRISNFDNARTVRRVAAGVLACRRGLASRRPDNAGKIQNDVRFKWQSPSSQTQRLYGRRGGLRYA